MTFDCSRFSFNSWNDYLGVVMQQGRVQLDSDWNEWLSELARRMQAGTMDTVGRAVYPTTTPFGFKINAFLDNSGTQHVSIGAGRMYVDGLSAENHGPAAAAPWDPSLAELSWTAPGAAEVDVDFTAQPYYPGAALPSGNGPYLAYLDVWRRPVSFLIDPSLVETAVAVDTTGRLQTVWQVRLLDVSSVSGGVICSTPDADIPPWQALVAPSAARLTTNVVPSPQAAPCAISPTTGYTGQENQLYRVQIHQGGTANASGGVANPSATFKWSRDNASVITAVTAINPATSSAQASTSQLTVQSTGRDQTLSFQPGDWIEITDDVMELDGAATGGPTGELHQIDTNGVVKAARTITLVTPVSAGLATRLAGPVNTHTRICRWDMNAGNGKVLLSDGATLWVDLSLVGTGQIPVPPPGTALILENGVTVAFDLNPTTGSFHVHDFWTFPARTANGSVGPLTEAPPMGVHHHYARLSVVTFPTTAPDCRLPWPPSASDTGCCCQVTVSPSDITATNSLQNVLDKYRNQTSETVICLKPGTYPLGAPLRLTSAHANITLTACPPGTAVLSAAGGQESGFGDGLIVLDNTSNTTLQGLQLVIPRVPFSPANGLFANQAVTSYDPEVQTLIDDLVVSIGVRPFNCAGLTIEECQFTFTAPREKAKARAIPFGVGVFAGGQCADWRLARNTFTGKQAFTAGFVLTPSVTFGQPTPAPAPEVLREERAPASLTLAATSAASSDLRASAPTASPAAPRKTPAKRVTTQAINKTTVATGLDQLQQITSEGTSSPGLAATGGAVIPSGLNNAEILENSFTDLTVATLVIGEAGAVRMVGNQTTDCQAGLWIVAPTEAEPLALDTTDLAIMVGSSIAIGYPPPQGDATTAVTVAAAPASVRVYAGAKSNTDGLSDVWTPDAAASTAFKVSGGALSQPSPPPTIINPLPTSSDQALYQSERYGTFTFTFAGLAEGYYQVTLKLAEIFWNAAQKRLIEVFINGVQVLVDFDIFADAGGKDIADDKVFANIPSSGDEIKIDFSAASYSPDQNAKVSAIAIDAQWSSSFVSASLSGSVRNPASVSELQNFCAQLTALAQQGFAGLAFTAPALRIDSNEMAGLSSSAVVILSDDSVQNGHTSSLTMSGNRLAGDVPQMAVATLIGVSQCVVCGNTILNQDRNSDRRVALTLRDSAVPTPQIAVTGNLFQGRAVISPQRYPSGSSLTYPLDSWDFLNTIS
jgi:hypothetical protein